MRWPRRKRPAPYPPPGLTAEQALANDTLKYMYALLSEPIDSALGTVTAIRQRRRWEMDSSWLEILHQACDAQGNSLWCSNYRNAEANARAAMFLLGLPVCVADGVFPRLSSG